MGEIKDRMHNNELEHVRRVPVGPPRPNIILYDTTPPNVRIVRSSLDLGYGSLRKERKRGVLEGERTLTCI